MDDQKRFAECAAAYGARRELWPEADRPLHDRLCTTPEGRALLAAAESVDHFLNAYPPAAADGAFLASLETLPSRQPPRPLTPTLSRRHKLALAAGFAAVAFTGFVHGAWIEFHGSPATSLDQQLMFGIAALRTQP